MTEDQSICRICIPVRFCQKADTGSAARSCPHSPPTHGATRETAAACGRADFRTDCHTDCTAHSDRSASIVDDGCCWSHRLRRPSPVRRCPRRRCLAIGFWAELELSASMECDRRGRRAVTMGLTGWAGHIQCGVHLAGLVVGGGTGNWCELDWMRRAVHGGHRFVEFYCGLLGYG